MSETKSDWQQIFISTDRQDWDEARKQLSEEDKVKYEGHIPVYTERNGQRHIIAWAASSAPFDVESALLASGLIETVHELNENGEVEVERPARQFTTEEKRAKLQKHATKGCYNRITDLDDALVLADGPEFYKLVYGISALRRKQRSTNPNFRFSEAVAIYDNDETYTREWLKQFVDFGIIRERGGWYEQLPAPQLFVAESDEPNGKPPDGFKELSLSKVAMEILRKKYRDAGGRPGKYLIVASPHDYE